MRLIFPQECPVCKVAQDCIFDPPRRGTMAYDEVMNDCWRALDEHPDHDEDDIRECIKALRGSY